MIKHHPRSIEDACANEYANRCGSAADRLCRFLSTHIDADGNTVTDAQLCGAQHNFDHLVLRWAQFAIARDQQSGALSPINPPRFLS